MKNCCRACATTKIPFYHFHDNRNCRPAESLMTLGIVATCLAALSALRAELVTELGAG